MAYLGAGITRFNTADGLTVKGTAEFTDTVVLGDSDELRFGDGADLKIYHNASNSVIEDAGIGQLLIRTNGNKIELQNSSLATLANFVSNGAVELYYDNVKRIETTSSGATITGDLTLTQHLEMGDGDEIRLGDSDDLKIYHDGSNSYVQDQGTGSLRIGSDSVVQIGKATAWGELMAQFTADGGCELRHDNAAKLNTSSSGIDVTGTVTADGLDVQGDGTISGGSRLTISDIADVNNDGIRLDDNTTSRFNNLTQDTSGNFKIQHWTGSAWQNNLTVTTGGDVGIGKSSSITDKLHIENTGANCLLSVSRTDGAAGRLVMQHTSAVGALQTTGSVPLTFGTNDSERMRIDSSGKVAIGTTSTAAGQLTIQSSGNQQLVVTDDGSEKFSMKVSGNDMTLEAGSGGSNSTNLIFKTASSGTEAEQMRIDSSGNVGINTSTFENTNGTELNLKGGTNNSKPAVITLQGGASNGAGYKQTEVFGISGVSSATEITRITGTGSNGMRMLIYVTAVGHTASHANAHTINKYYWDGGTNAPQTISIEASTYGAPGITFDVTTSNRCIIKLTSGNGTGSFNGIMEVQWFVPIDFASSTWQVS